MTLLIKKVWRFTNHDDKKNIKNGIFEKIKLPKDKLKKLFI